MLWQARQLFATEVIAVIVDETFELEVRPGKGCINAETTAVFPTYCGLNSSAVRTAGIGVEVAIRKLRQFKRNQLVLQVDLEKRYLVLKVFPAARVDDLEIIGHLRSQ